MKKAKAEKLITLPTRGVFAEGKLGHCNVSEEIDNTRFWKWEEHPIPFEAPGINPVTPVTPQPQQTNIAPTPFPSSLVNIVNPSAAPDPTGLGDALKLLSTPNIFRDMSGRAEVADLLKRLSDNTIGIVEAANKAMEIRAKYGGDLAGNTGGSGSKPGGSSGSGGSTGSPSSSGSSGGNSSGADELNKRVDAVKGMTGYVDPKEIKETMAELNKFARKRSLFDDGAIASNDSSFVPGANTAPIQKFVDVWSSVDKAFSNSAGKFKFNRELLISIMWEESAFRLIRGFNPSVVGIGQVEQSNIPGLNSKYRLTLSAAKALSNLDDSVLLAAYALHEWFTLKGNDKKAALEGYGYSGNVKFAIEHVIKSEEELVKLSLTTTNILVEKSKIVDTLNTMMNKVRPSAGFNANSAF